LKKQHPNEFVGNVGIDYSEEISESSSENEYNRQLKKDLSIVKLN